MHVRQQQTTFEQRTCCESFVSGPGGTRAFPFPPRRDRTPNQLDFAAVRRTRFENTGRHLKSPLLSIQLGIDTPPYCAKTHAGNPRHQKQRHVHPPRYDTAIQPMIIKQHDQVLTLYRGRMCLHKKKITTPPRRLDYATNI